MLDTADLNQNLALTRLEVRVDPDDLDLIPPLLHETLLTIRSPAFSEFVLRIEGLPANHKFLYELSVGTVWGDDWWIIDRDLNDMVTAAGRDIKFVVRVGTFAIWGIELQGFVGGVFPLMNARGLVKAPLPSSIREGVRYVL